MLLSVALYGIGQVRALQGAGLNVLPEHRPGQSFITSSQGGRSGVDGRQRRAVLRVVHHRKDPHSDAGLNLPLAHCAVLQQLDTDVDGGEGRWPQYEHLLPAGGDSAISST